MPRTKKPHTPSPAGLKRIAAAQRKRWSDPLRSDESAIQAAVFEHLEHRATPGTFLFHPANGGKRPASTGKQLKVQGVVPGVPDVAGIVDGKPAFLELKTERGRLSPVQEAVRDRIVAAGGLWAVAKGLDAALKQLEAWGAIYPEGARASTARAA